LLCRYQAHPLKPRLDRAQCAPVSDRNGVQRLLRDKFSAQLLLFGRRPVSADILRKRGPAPDPRVCGIDCTDAEE
jgi:hypothetical protein